MKEQDNVKSWIAVASAEHVRRGRREGFTPCVRLLVGCVFEQIMS